MLLRSTSTSCIPLHHQWSVAWELQDFGHGFVESLLGGGGERFYPFRVRGEEVGALQPDTVPLKAFAEFACLVFRRAHRSQIIETAPFEKAAEKEVMFKRLCVVRQVRHGFAGIDEGLLK